MNKNMSRADIYKSLDIASGLVLSISSNEVEVAATICTICDIVCYKDKNLNHDRVVNMVKRMIGTLGEIHE